jgi:hypothetical protein
MRLISGWREIDGDKMKKRTCRLEAANGLSYAKFFQSPCGIANLCFEKKVDLSFLLGYK